MLQNSSATTITTAETKERVMKIFRIKITRAPACHALPADTVKVVSTVTWLSDCIPDCLSETLRCCVKSAKIYGQHLFAFY